MHRLYDYHDSLGKEYRILTGFFITSLIAAVSRSPFKSYGNIYVSSFHNTLWDL